MQLLTRMRRRLGGLDVSPRTHARINQTAKRLQRGPIDGLSLGLHVVLVPVETEPAEVFDRLRGGTRLVLRMIEVLHAEDHLAALVARAKPGDHERAHVPEMQRARRARRKATDIPTH